VSISAEIVLGGAVMLLAVWLGSISPGAHDQPVWPFPWQLDADALALRPNREALALSLVVTGLAVAALASSLAWRRFRLAAIALLAAALAWRIPSLSPLFTEAYPTSFFTSPTGFAASGILRGAPLFQDNCAACHGPQGRGDGPAATTLPVRPANLAEGHVLSHADGELFWRLQAGFQAADGRVLMPAFGAVLTDDERWRLIDYVRANAVGQSLTSSGVLPYPLPLPSFPIACDGPAADRPEDLRGKAIHVIAGMDADSPVLASAGSVPVVRLYLTRGTAPAPSAGCVSQSADAWPAFAVLAGVPPDRLDGTQFLIDPAGLIRRIWRPNQAGPTGDPIALLAAVRDICENPATPVFGEVHEHNH
jgi:mono/diheme cytochrome c family protein